MSPDSSLADRPTCSGNVFQMQFIYISIEGGTHNLLFYDYANVGPCVVLGKGFPRLVVPTQAHVLGKGWQFLSSLIILQGNEQMSCSLWVKHEYEQTSYQYCYLKNWTNIS